MARLVIEAPVPGLQAISLIETPGVSSSAVQETGRSALAQILSEADAVLYLTRYPQQTDVQFLQSVHELQLARRAPINTIVAFSRADETGNGGSGALQAAERISLRYRDDPTVRAFAQYVIPVVGLLGQAAATLTDEDFASLVALRQLPESSLEALLLSADRFANNSTPESVPTSVRQGLLEKFGRYGVAQALTALGEGVSEPKKLSAQLLEASRLNDLQEAVYQQFIERQEALRARSALLAVDMALRANPRPGVQQLLGEFERLLANAPEWEELRLLTALQSGQLSFPRPLQNEARRLLGGQGQDAPSRLGQESDTLESILAEEASSALARWRDQLVNPMHDRAPREAVRVVLRSCERIIAARMR